MAKIKINDAEYYYELHGKGQPIVFIAGYGSDHNAWLSILEPLAQQFQVLLFDNRGVGQTMDDGRALTVELMADDVMALCEALNLKKPHIIGSSMGGTIAQNIAARYPDKISKLGLLSSVAKWRQAMLKGFKTSIVMRKNNMPFDAIYDNLLAWVFSETFLQNPTKVDYLRNLIVNNPYPQSLENQERQFQVLERFDGRDLLSKIKAPTLVAHGSEDIVSLYDETQVLVKGINGAQFVQFDHCGHPIAAEAGPQLAKVLLAFLS